MATQRRGDDNEQCYLRPEIFHHGPELQSLASGPPTHTSEFSPLNVM